MGSNGLAVLTSGGQADVYENGLGMLYLVQDASFVSGAAAQSSTAGQESAALLEENLGPRTREAGAETSVVLVNSSRQVDSSWQDGAS